MRSTTHARSAKGKRIIKLDEGVHADQSTLHTHLYGIISFARSTGGGIAVTLWASYLVALSRPDELASAAMVLSQTMVRTPVGRQGVRARP